MSTLQSAPGRTPTVEMINGGMNPYREALAWFAQAPSSASSIGLAKLILSLSKIQHPFSLADCLASITGPQRRMAMRIIAHYEEYGANDELQVVAEEVCRQMPRLVVLGHAMTQAARQLVTTWLDDQDNRACRRTDQPDEE